MAVNWRCFLGLACAAALLLNSAVAHASAVALSDITASNLQVTSSGATITFDSTFDTFAFALAQNSLGGLDALFDAETNLASTVGASVTWANGNATAGDTAWEASSQVAIPAAVAGTGSSQGQAQFSRLFTVDAAGRVDVRFSVDLATTLQLLTNPSGLLAETEAIFNLLVDGDTVLFVDLLQSIGPSASFTQVASPPIVNTVTLDPGSHSLLLRVDSESRAINGSAVPEPATLTLLGVGLVAARRYGWKGRVSHR